MGGAAAPMVAPPDSPDECGAPEPAAAGTRTIGFDWDNPFLREVFLSVLEFATDSGVENFSTLRLWRALSIGDRDLADSAARRLLADRVRISYTVGGASYVQREGPGQPQSPEFPAFPDHQYYVKRWNAIYKELDFYTKILQMNITNLTIKEINAAHHLGGVFRHVDPEMKLRDYNIENVHLLVDSPPGFRSDGEAHVRLKDVERIMRSAQAYSSSTMSYFWCGGTPPAWCRYKKYIISDTFNCELCRMKFRSMDAFSSHVVGDVRSRQVEKLQRMGLRRYFQLCFDDEGPYVVSHSPGQDDLQVFGVPDENTLTQNWVSVFGCTPDQWEDEFSVVSFFRRERWKLLKENVDRLRNDIDNDLD
jgi:hypothetical protein